MFLSFQHLLKNLPKIRRDGSLAVHMVMLIAVKTCHAKLMSNVQASAVDRVPVMGVRLAMLLSLIASAHELSPPRLTTAPLSIKKMTSDEEMPFL